MFGLFKVQIGTDARRKLKSDESMHVDRARDIMQIYPKGAMVIWENMANQPIIAPAAAPAVSAAPNMDEIVWQAVQDQLRKIMATQGAAEKVMKETTQSEERKSEKQLNNSAATRNVPSLEIILLREESDRVDSLHEIRGVSPAIQSEDMPRSGINLLPVGDPQLGPTFQMQGVAAPLVNFLNQSQLRPMQPGGVTAVVAPIPTAAQRSFVPKHPVPIAPAPERSQPITSVSPSPQKKMKSTNRETKERSASRGRKCLPSTSSSHDGSREDRG